MHESCVLQAVIFRSTNEDLWAKQWKQNETTETGVTRICLPCDSFALMQKNKRTPTRLACVLFLLWELEFNRYPKWTLDGERAALMWMQSHEVCCTGLRSAAKLLSSSLPDRFMYATKQSIPHVLDTYSGACCIHEGLSTAHSQSCVHLHTALNTNSSEVSYITVWEQTVQLLISWSLISERILLSCAEILYIFKTSGNQQF